MVSPFVWIGLAAFVVIAIALAVCFGGVIDRCKKQGADRSDERAAELRALEAQEETGVNPLYSSTSYTHQAYMNPGANFDDASAEQAQTQTGISTTQSMNAPPPQYQDVIKEDKSQLPPYHEINYL